jgi:hypothetical protein
VDAFVAGWVARRFSQLTIDNGTGVCERFLSISGNPALELEPEDIDAIMAALIDRGVGPVTRRGYVGHSRRSSNLWRQAADPRLGPGSAQGIQVLSMFFRPAAPRWK